MFLLTEIDSECRRVNGKSKWKMKETNVASVEPQKCENVVYKLINKSCLNIAVDYCGYKNAENLKSYRFHEHRSFSLSTET